MKTQLLISLKIFALFTVLCGVAYPLLITGIAQLAFPKQANGSLIILENKIAGSELIGQKFDQEKYFWSRPSATDYSAMPSGGSNLSPSSEKLKQQVTDRTTQWNTVHAATPSETIPSEMLLASASGLDPHITPRAAMLQLDRIAKIRKFNDAQKQQLIQLVNFMNESPQFGLLGEERVNVLLLNLKLDKIK